MIENLSPHITITFLATCVLTFYLFIKSIRNSAYKKNIASITIGILIWMSLQAILSYSLFYLNTVNEIPPKFPLIGFLPTIIFMVILFNTKRGKRFIDSLPLKDLTLISIVRIPVEFVLFWLATEKWLPLELTFEGINFDILAGITAPLIVYFGFLKNKLNKNIILGWNFICLILLTIIVGSAVLSFPTPFQQLHFETPTLGVLYFPFAWLPSFIVPIVFFTHFVSIRQLLKK